MDKQKLRDLFKSSGKVLCSVIGRPAKLIELVGKLLLVYAVLVVLNTFNNLSKSGFEGDIQIVGRDDKGKLTFGTFKAKKTAPILQHDHMVSVKYGTDGSHSYGYHRQAFEILGYRTYLGGEITSKKNGSLEGAAVLNIAF